jgi:radical SAM protein with 4Fe4S-binding SPASM domain
MKFPIRHIIFEVTHNCNLSCKYCYNHWRRSGSQSLQTTVRETDKTLSNLLKTIDFEHITFTGGEPFLAGGLLELVLKCRMNAKGVTIITNGTVADYKEFKFLIDMGVSLFELPLHSDSMDIHDHMTGHPGSFEKVVESIKMLSELGANICVATVLTKLNIDRFRHTLAFAQQLGIKRLMIARFNIGGRGIENVETLLPSLTDLRGAFCIANEFSQTNGMRISANVCVPLCIIDPGDLPHIPISTCASDAKKRPITLDFSGNFRICNHSPHILGNIHCDSLIDMFDSPYVKSWEVDCPDYCSGCSQWHACRGGCRAASEQTGRTLHAVDPIVEILSPGY